MSSPSQDEKQQLVQKQKMMITADLLRRGATLLRESCPRCGGLQVRFNDRVYCVNEDNIESVLYPREQTIPESQQALETRASYAPEKDASSPFGEKESLKKLLRDKLNSASLELQSTKDIDRQSKLLDLISKYVEILSKLE